MNISNLVGRILLKRYGKWFCDEKNTIKKIINRYSVNEIICMSIGDNPYELATVVAVSFLITQCIISNIYIYTNTFRYRFFKNQILKLELSKKINNSKNNLIITIGSNVEKSENYLKLLGLQNNTYDLIALDYEIMDFISK